MRSCGVMSSLDDLGPSDHGVWGYASVEDLATATSEFLSGSRAIGMRRSIVSFGSPFPVVAVPVTTWTGQSSVEMTTLGSVPGRPWIEPTRDVRLLRQAAERAVGDGYRGLRMVVEASPLVARPSIDAFTEFAQQADRLMAELENVSLVFVYDRSLLDPAIHDDLECVHPVSNHEASFRVFVPDAHADIAIIGELDAFNAAGFERALIRSYVPSEHPWVIDASRVEFIDHRAMLAIERAAERLGTTAIIETHCPQPGRIALGLGLHRVTVVEWPRLTTDDITV